MKNAGFYILDLTTLFSISIYKSNEKDQQILPNFLLEFPHLVIEHNIAFIVGNLYSTAQQF